MFWWWPFGKVSQISREELQTQLRSKRPPQLVDVRSEGEYEQGHIRGARSVPIQRLSGQIKQMGLDPKRPVIAICKTAHRSVPAVRLLRQHGFDAHQLEGGMDAWRDAKFPEVKG